ncbi:MAG: hypothetical protein ACQESR_27695 [Planctomycetota bacterium]
MNEIVRRTVHVAAMFPAVLVTHDFGDWNQGAKKLCQETLGPGHDRWCIHLLREPQRGRMK